MTRWITFLATLGLLMSGLTACNTIQGLGRDIEKSGEAIQRAAK